MIDNLPKKTITKLKVLAIYQVIGGILGLGLTGWIMGKEQMMSVFLFFIFLIPTALYSYSIYCGRLLLKKKDIGIRHSLINQFLQLISFAISGYAFQYVSGIYLSIGFSYTEIFNLKFDFGLASVWQISIGTDTPTFLINLNLVALFLIVFINKVKKKIKEESFEAEVLQIGEFLNEIL